MKIKRMMLLVPILFYACSAEDSQTYTFYSLESGKTIKIVQMGQCSLNFPETEETGIALTYQTSLAVGNESKLDQEMAEISEWLEVEAEKIGVRLININAVETIGASKPKSNGKSIVLRKEIDGQWHSIELLPENRYVSRTN